jgi:hypothetical protein
MNRQHATQLPQPEDEDEGTAAVSRLTAFTIAALLVAIAAASVEAPLGASRTAARASAVTMYPDGAPPGFSGGFGEQSCHGCHFHQEINAGPGRVTIADVPQRFIAGERYTLTVALTQPGLRLGGFQLTARAKDGGAQAGTLAPASGEEKRIGIEVQSNVQYANQRQPGTAPVAVDTARWSLVWTAPDLKGPVVFHVAANAADADETVAGDFIYTTVVEAAPDQRRR